MTAGRGARNRSERDRCADAGEDWLRLAWHAGRVDHRFVNAIGPPTNAVRYQLSIARTSFLSNVSSPTASARRISAGHWVAC